jgi:ABC-type transport system substrate-binding protein
MCLRDFGVPFSSYKEEKMVNRKTIYIVLGIIVVAAIAFGVWMYVGKGSAVSSGFKSKDPSTFVTLEFGNVDTLDTALAYDSASGEIIQQTYDVLVFTKRDSITELVPMLASEVPSASNGGISADGKTYIFKIRPGVKFQMATR